MTGVEMIAAERQRQVEGEGWTAEHDDGHVAGELAWAAVCYAAPECVYVPSEALNAKVFRDPWPFAAADSGGRYGGDWDRRKNGPLGSGNIVNDMPDDGDVRLDFLVKAGAFIAAEIDRLKRAASDEERAK